ncbi:hypothetical protein BGZ65_008605, partial [Modicella reniformis]
MSFLRNRNSSFQTLQSTAQQQQQQQQQQEYETTNPAFRQQGSKNSQSGSIRSGRDSMSVDMNSQTKGKTLTKRSYIPPAAPTAIKISNSTTVTKQVQGRLSSIKLKPIIGASGTATAAATTATAAGTGTATTGHKMLFRNISARFSSSTDAFPAAETVAQEYARTIKALWRMVEEEELSYQIDAAATAARQLQEESQRLLLLNSAKNNNNNNNNNNNKPRHNYKTFPGQRDQAHHDQDDDDVEICRQPCCSSNTNGSNRHSTSLSHTSRGNPFIPSSSSSSSSSSHSPLDPITNVTCAGDADNCGEEEEEDQEHRLLELQQLERELVILGLQRYQDASYDIAPSSPLPHCRSSSGDRQYDSRRESFQESKMQPEWALEQAQQTEQFKSPFQQQQQPQPQRRQRQRHNSLAYDERCIELVTLRTQVKAFETAPKASIKATTTTTTTTGTTHLLDFHD